MTKPTNQSVFTRSVRFLLKQGKPSVTRIKRSESKCAYRGNNNTRCAIGAVLPDLLYDPRMEGKDALALLHNYPKVEEHFKYVTNSLLWDMQAAHDETAELWNRPSKNANVAWMEDWRDAITKIATNWNLKLPKEFNTP